MASTAVFALPEGSSWQPAIWMQQFLWTTLHGRPLSDGRIRGRPAPRVKNLLEGGGQAAVRECFTSPARPTAGQPLLTGRPLAGSRLWRCREVASDFGVWPRCASLRAPPRGTQEAVRVRTSWRGRPGTSSPGHSCRWRRPSFRRPKPVAREPHESGPHHRLGDQPRQGRLVWKPCTKIWKSSLSSFEIAHCTMSTGW